jgi:hypothetical protein
MYMWGPTVAENMLYRNLPHTPKNLRHQSRGELAGRCGGYRNEILFHCMLNKCAPPGEVGAETLVQVDRGFRVRSSRVVYSV